MTPYDPTSQYDPNDPNNQQQGYGAAFPPASGQQRVNYPWTPVYGNVGQFPGGITGSYGTAAPGMSVPGLDLNQSNDPQSLIYNNMAIAYAQGQGISNELQNALQYYGPTQARYQGLTDEALARLNQMPGFSPEEASQIGVDYSRYNTSPENLQRQFLTPDEQRSIYGDPYAAKDQLDRNVQAEGTVLNQYQSGLGGNLANYENWLGGATGQFQTGAMTSAAQSAAGVGAAQAGLERGLQGAQSGFSKLDQAVNNPALQFDPNRTQRQMSDADVQNIVTAAGNQVGSRYRASVDDLQRAAAASGITDPMALEVAKNRLLQQGAAQSADAMTQAQIEASQAQYGRAAAIEQARENAALAQTGLQANAATTEQSQAQNAAALAGMQGMAGAQYTGTQGMNAALAAGQAGINAAQSAGQAGLNVANLSGQAAINQQNLMTQQQYGASSAAEQAAANRAAQIAGNRQVQQGAVNQTQYQQGVGSQQLTSAGQQALGGARMGGQQQYRTGLAGQQVLAQQGAGQTIGQQIQTYGTQGDLLGKGAQNRTSYDAASYGQGLGTAFGNAAAGLISGGAKAVAGKMGLPFEHGGDVNEPTLTLVGEKGPELIMPIMRSRYRSSERMAA